MDTTIGPKPSSFKLNYLDSQSCKQDEIDVIHKLVNAYNGQSCYLSELFTPALLSWVSSQLKNDFPVNLYQDFLDQAEEVRELETACHKQAKEIETLHQNHQEYALQVEKEITHQRDLVQSWMKVSEGLKNESSDRLDLIVEKERIINNLIEEAAGLNQKIIELKALLYDQISS